MFAPADSNDIENWGLLVAAWAIALVSTLGALFIGEVMGQAPCNLCWFQRAFMFPLAVILAVACYFSDMLVWRYAIPIAAFGWLIALWHNLLYFGIVPASLEPCGAGPSCSDANMVVLAVMPLPVLSLAAFTTILVMLGLVRWRTTL